MSDTFVAPPFLHGQSADTIHARMLATLPEDIDRGEGGFPWDFTRPTAVAEAEFVQYRLINTIRSIFPKFCDAYLLDDHAAVNGMKRRAAESARVILKLSGDAGTEIPAGFMVSTEASYNQTSISFTLDETVTLGADPVSVTATAIDPGAASNVGANTITIVDTPIKGLRSISNPSPAFGGINEEDDESLRSRIVEYEETQGESYVGSVADYKRWAMEVAGVGAVSVEGGQNGDCTVKITLTGLNGKPASDEVCQDVYDHIMRDDDPDLRLAGICDLLEVRPAEKVTISVSATVELDGTILLADVAEELRLRLEQYYHSADGAETGKIRYTEIGSRILACAGVTDYDPETLLVNGGNGNIAIGTGQIPVTESTDITLQEKAVT